MAYKILFFLLSFNVMAASVGVIRGQFAPQLSKGGVPSYFVNPICERNDQGVTDADAIAACVSSGGLSDAGTSWRIDADASGEKAVWTWTTYPKRLEGGNCVIGGTYTGDFANYEVNVIQNSVTLVTANATGSDFPTVTGKQPFEVSFICGSDNANLVTVEVEATDNAAGQLDLIWEQGGENTNIGSAAQPEVVVRASGNPTGGLNGTTATIWGTEGLDTYGIYNNSTGIITAQKAGEYCWKAAIKVDGTSALDNFLLLSAEKNGAIVPGEHFVRAPGAVSSLPVQSNGCVDLAAGDTLEFVTDTNISGAAFLGGEENYLVITRFPSASEQVFKVGAPYSELTAFTVVSTVTTSATHTGNAVCIGGGLAQVNYFTTFGGANTQGFLEYDLPTGLTFNTSKLLTTNGSYRQFHARGSFLDAATAVFGLTASYVDSNTIRASVEGAALTYVNYGSFDTSANIPVVIANGDGLNLSVIIPVNECPRTSTGLFKNAVTTSSEGVIRMESAVLACSGTPSIVKQNGSWVASGSQNAAGDCSWTLASGFSSYPVCTCTVRNSGSFNCNIHSVPTTSTLRLFTYNTTTGVGADVEAHVQCMGPN